MTKTTYTPGPWYVGAQNDCLFIINKPPSPSTDDIVDGPADLAVIAKLPDGSRQSEADARLIAAAPRLLAALKGLFSNSLNASGWEEASQAIDKAEGK